MTKPAHTTTTVTAADLLPLFGLNDFMLQWGSSNVVDFANRVLAHFGVSEHDARSRALNAYTQGWVDHRDRGDEHGMIFDHMLAKRFPPLGSERSVTLSTGETHWYTKAGGWQGNIPNGTVPGGVIAHFGMPRCVTASDFEKCAALVREIGP